MRWQWTRDEIGKIKLKRGAGLGGTLGQCLMEPYVDEKDFRFWLYNAGGGLVNFIMGLIFIVCVFLVGGSYSKMIFLGLGMSSIISGVINLIPIEGILNDGRNIIEANKSADAKHGLYMMLKINAEMSRGKLLTDYPADAFVVSKEADINNFFVSYMLLLRAGQLEESGAYDQSYQVLSIPDSKKLPPFYGYSILLHLMFHELVYFGDEASIQRSRDRMEVNFRNRMFLKLLTMKHPSYIPFHAAKTAFLDNDKVKARELISEARKLNSSQQNPGMEHSVTFMLDGLEARMEKECTSTLLNYTGKA
jgi:hypothetical protein